MNRRNSLSRCYILDMHIHVYVHVYTNTCECVMQTIAAHYKSFVFNVLLTQFQFRQFTIYIYYLFSYFYFIGRFYVP